MRRYERHVEVDYPDVDTVMPMLVAAAGNADLARAGYDLEVFTRTQIVDEIGMSGSADGEGLLKRPMNFSTTRALLDEVRELTLTGVPASAAFVRAARSTALPYCVPRQPNGTLDPAARQRLEDDIHRFASRLGTEHSGRDAR